MKGMKGMKLALLIGIVLLAAGAWAQSDDSAAEPKAEKVEKPVVLPPADAPSDYLIGADDVLRITVWHEPDLTETLPVRPDGKISMPLLNDVQAAGLSPVQLKDSLTEKLRKYIADPHVTVVVTAMNSRRIFVSGEVVHSGPMALLPHMTILQALSQAGFTQFANLKSIYLLRAENGQQKKYAFNYKDVIKGNHPEQNFELKPGDTVVVP
jgi:polysaccharide export outer membrane protein